MNSNISKAIRNSLKGGVQWQHWEDIVGYTKEDLTYHLEKLFQNNMTWNNYGKWHIDHIIPLVLWEFEDYSSLEFKKCWSRANLQPLWARDNLSKGSRI